MRVESAMPSKNGGWFHTIKGRTFQRPIRKINPVMEQQIDVKSFWDNWLAIAHAGPREELSKDLGVTNNSLFQMQCVFVLQHNAFAFPMKDAEEKMIGIRFRNWVGEKWSLKGSRNGLFIPDIPVEQTVYICEGPTDCAAALSIGLYAIGRPSCSGGVDLIQKFVERNEIRKVIIIADNDTPGLKGAQTLSENLKVPNAIIITPAKDVRAFVNAGGDKSVIDCIVNCTIWNR
jgi:5S rRNA maturation endonuclease (ribonuclease M5)